MQLVILKIYIKTDLETGFILHFNFLADIFILFDKKPNGSFCLYVDY